MKKNEYLIIDTDNVFIKLNGVDICSTDIFNKVLEKHKKIILKLCNNRLYPIRDAIELLTGIPFKITGNEIKKENNKLIINANDTNNLSLFIETEFIKYSNSDVSEFYNDLKNSNDLENYIESLNILFKYNINKKNYEKKLLKLK